MHRLYLYYCYQLGILPKKQQPRINRPELERIWKDTEKILAEHAFVHDHKFPSLQAIVDYRKSLSQQMETLAAQRAEIVKQMRRKDVPSELADRRAMLTCKIAELRKEDRIAEGAIKRIQRTRESNRIENSRYLLTPTVMCRTRMLLPDICASCIGNADCLRITTCTPCGISTQPICCRKAPANRWQHPCWGMRIRRSWSAPTAIRRTWRNSRPQS